jgi:hypothetical protein
MARGYDTEAVQSLIGEKEGGPFGFLKQAFGNTMGKWAMDKRRPVGYETEKDAANVTGDPTEQNWTNTTREALYAKLFGQDPRFGSGIYKQDESGAYVLNPDAEGEDAKKAKEIQIMMNESFAKAKKGKKVSHPDFPDAGESFYRGTDKTMGEAYYDEEGNIVDYWDIGLDEGEKVFDWGAMMPGGEPFVNKANLQRAIVDPFTTPATFTGKATDTGNILGKFGGFGGGDEDAPIVTTPASKDVKVPIDEPKGESLLSKVTGKAGGFLGGAKDKVGGFMGDIKESLIKDGGYQGTGGGSGIKTPVSKVSDFTEGIKGKSAPISGTSQGKDIVDYGESDFADKGPSKFEGGGRDFLAGAGDRLGEIFGAMKGAFKPKEVMSDSEGTPGVKTPVFNMEKYGPGQDRRIGGPQERPSASEEDAATGLDILQGEGEGFNRQAIMKALGFGDDEEEEDYEASMMDKFKGLGYRGSAKQNMALMEKMGGRGPSIVDYLKSQGEGSSMDARRKLWEQYG